jgi:ABC-2 type transport system permease protein
MAYAIIYPILIGVLLSYFGYIAFRKKDLL